MKTYQGIAEAEARTKRDLSRARMALLAFMLGCIAGISWAVWGQVEARDALIELVGPLS